MPLIRAIERTADGFIVTRSDGTVVTVTSADIPGSVKNKPIPEIEAWVNSRLAANNYNAVCRIRSITPLDIDIAIGNAGDDLSSYRFSAGVNG